MNYDLANQYMSLKIMDMQLGYTFLVAGIIAFLFLCICCGISEFQEKRDRDRREKLYWKHIKEVQDRFKDDDLR
jgi:hypothetical protein